MEYFKYAFNILIVSDGIYSIHLGGLQADLMGGVQYIYGYVYLVLFTTPGPVTFRRSPRSGAMRHRRRTAKALRGASLAPYKLHPGTSQKT